MNKRLFLWALLAMLMTGVEAKVRLSHLVGDNMVVQQQTQVRLWGWARANSTVTVTTSLDKQRVKVKADQQGRFLATVGTPAASFTPLSITFNDGDGDVTIQNVLAGEVWVCAGQSNMEMPVKGFGNCPVLNYNQEVIESAAFPYVRSVKVPSVMSAKPLDDANCEWRVCSPQTVGDFSATGYFFAKMVTRMLQIPVGLIEANKGGTRVESWLTKENLEKYTNDPTDSVEICKKWAQWDYHRSLLWGNGTFNPILNATIKGILFYQGCSNVGDPVFPAPQTPGGAVAQSVQVGRRSLLFRPDSPLRQWRQAGYLECSVTGAAVEGFEDDSQLRTGVYQRLCLPL